MRSPIMASGGLALVVCIGVSERTWASGQVQPASSLASSRSSSPHSSSDLAPAASVGGPADMIMGDVQGVQNWGGIGGVAAYSLGRVFCNVGTVNLAAQQFTNQHQVSAMNMYRWTTVDGATRFEQLGQSWLHHAFCELQQTLCGVCIPAGGGCVPALGIGCSSPYTPAGGGTQNNMGPRYDINASTGAFTLVSPAAPITSLPANLLGKRIQIANSDLNPALHPGAQYYAEDVVVHPQDGQSGNTANNASYRRATVGALTGTPPNQSYQLSLTGTTVRELPALHAWKVIDPTVTILNVDVPDDGRMVVAADATEIAPGTWHYEYAIYNISSHRSGGSFRVPLPPGVVVSNIGFRDIDYHTQELLQPWARCDNIDWTTTVIEAVPGASDGSITWSTSAYTGPAPDGNEHTANALRWGTLYNFRFDADAPPAEALASIGLFRPGTPEMMTVAAPGPAAVRCTHDLDGDGTVNALDLAALLAAWGPCAACAADFDGDGIVNGLDLAALLAAWNACA
jgi:Dockerin type I domain